MVLLGIFSGGGSRGLSAMMMKKPMHMELVEIFSIQHPLWKGKISSSKENSPFLFESTLFIRETPFLIRLPIIFLGGTGLRSLERALVFPVVGFEPGSTVPLRIQKLYCQFIPIHCCGDLYCCSKSSVLLRQSGYWTKIFCLFHFHALVNQTKDLQTSKMTYLVIGQVLYEVPFYESL